MVGNRSSQKYQIGKNTYHYRGTLKLKVKDILIITEGKVQIIDKLILEYFTEKVS